MADYCVCCRNLPCVCEPRNFGPLIDPGVFAPVTHPDDYLVKIHSDGSSSGYYQLPPGAVEIQDLVEYKGMNFSVGNIFKAAYRLGQKAGNDDLYDIRKILWYANREKARLEKLQQEKA